MAQTDGDTKKRLLAVALEIVDSEGVSGLTIRKIAERAGVTVSVVHHHYLNKQGLVDACKTTFFDGLAPIVGGIVAGVATRPLPQTIERAVREIWSYARSHVALVRVVAADAAADGQLIEEYRSYEDRPFLAAATSVLAPALGLSVVQGIFTDPGIVPFATQSLVRESITRTSPRPSLARCKYSSISSSPSVSTPGLKRIGWIQNGGQLRAVFA